MHKLLLLLAISLPTTALSQEKLSEPPPPPEVMPEAEPAPAPTGPLCVWELVNGKVVRGRLLGNQGQLLSVRKIDGQNAILRAEDVAQAPPACMPEGVRITSAAKPPSATDFTGRMALVALGAGLGEIAGYFLGATLGGLSNSYTGFAIGLIVGPPVGAALGATLGGSFFQGAGSGAVIGAFVGAAVGMTFAVLLLGPTAGFAAILPALGAALGYGVGLNLQPPASAPPPGVKVGSSGLRVAPVAGLARGGGLVGLAGSF